MDDGADQKHWFRCFTRIGRSTSEQWRAPRDRSQSNVTHVPRILRLTDVKQMLSITD